ncbi:hypothetical protein JW935_20815 [candidate division KSB1 bacterium]|nr:hypothetical protein [candidate division KSB1 bacterium]
MKKMLFMFAIVCVLYTGDVVFSNQLNVVIHELDPVIGEMIDVEENSLYTIYGDIPGFCSAGFLLVDGSKYQFYVLRNTELGAQIYISTISEERLTKLREELTRRIAEKAGESKTPLFPLLQMFPEEQSVYRELQLRDGNRIMGDLTRARHDTLFVRTTGGLLLPIPAYQIQKVIEKAPVVSGVGFYRTDPNTSRLFFAPTARKLKKGTGYFADYYIFFPTLGYGLTENIALSGGMSILPGLDTQLFSFAPKVAFDLTNNLSLGTGVLVLFVPDEDPVDLCFTVMTYGNIQKAITVGAGIPVFAWKSNNPILMVGAETQISNSVKLLSENWMFTGDFQNSLFSVGIRFFGDRLAADLALITLKELFNTEGFPFIPYVGFSYCFGR